MGMAKFIKKRFVGKEIFIYMGELAETIALDQSWMPNKEINHGVALEVDEEVVIFKTMSGPIIFINADKIKYFWQKDCDFTSCAEGCLTKKLPGAKNKVKKND